MNERIEWMEKQMDNLAMPLLELREGKKRLNKKNPARNMDMHGSNHRRQASERLRKIILMLPGVDDPL